MTGHIMTSHQQEMIDLRCYICGEPESNNLTREHLGLSPDDKVVMVRIHDPDHIPARPAIDCNEMHCTSFYDVDGDDMSLSSQMAGYDVQYMKPYHAQDILSFFEHVNHDNPFMIIHCGYGYSRSPAIALGWALFTGNRQLKHFILGSKEFHLNRYCFALMREAINEHKTS